MTKRQQTMSEEPPVATRRAAWSRDVENLDEGAKLGLRLKAFREQQHLSLNAASEASGVAAATLSRIENNKMMPTFGLMVKLMKGLRMSWADLMIPGGILSAEQQVSIADPQTTNSLELENYAPLHPESPLNFRIAPVLVELSAKKLSDTDGLTGHVGIEFCYVLSGTLVIHFAGRPPQQIAAGGSALFNSQIPHTYLSKGRGPTRLLIVSGDDPLSTDEDGDPSILWAALTKRFTKP